MGSGRVSQTLYTPLRREGSILHLGVGRLSFEDSLRDHKGSQSHILSAKSLTPQT